MTIELETFYSRRLGSFWWDEAGEKEHGGGVSPSLQNMKFFHCFLSRDLPGGRPKAFSYSDPLIIFTCPRPICFNRILTDCTY